MSADSDNFPSVRKSILLSIKEDEIKGMRGDADAAKSVGACFRLTDRYISDTARIFDSMLISHAICSLEVMKGGAEEIGNLIIQEWDMHQKREAFREKSKNRYPDLVTHEDAALAALGRIKKDPSVVEAYKAIGLVYPEKTLEALRETDSPYVVDAIREVSKLNRKRGLMSHNISGLNSLSHLYDLAVVDDLEDIYADDIADAVTQLSADILRDVSGFIACLDKTPGEARDNYVADLSAAFKAIDERQMLGEDKELSPAIEKVLEYYKKSTGERQDLQAALVQS